MKPIKIGILTSSRADFGIYLPLLKRMQEDSSVDFDIIAFGTHLSKSHGHTIDDIQNHGFVVKHSISGMLIQDDPEAIVTAYALTAMKFAAFWAQHQKEYNWILCLGDRYEMAAAVAAGVPFNVRFAHIHGGETTLGAIDNIYRHAITLASLLHFVSTEEYKKRVLELVGDNADCIVSGSLSLENLNEIKLLTLAEFLKQWGIDMTKPSILVTIHPETIDYKRNIEHAEEFTNALEKLCDTWQIIITLPNADTSGSIYRESFEKLKTTKFGKIYTIENFGTQSYFTCMKYSDFLLGNTSSGIIEAASLGKYVINVGERQKGRLCSDNVFHSSFEAEKILVHTNKIKGKRFDGVNIYHRKTPSLTILNKLKALG